ncbi:hypothetical protein BJV78DRAFT_1284923 [Lactifluus subvellereus]|nr:hypothetical protein BJV78DRAFT_1284923 [Lactifluus subvellereus]
MSFSPRGSSISRERVTPVPPSPSRLSYDCSKNLDDHVRQSVDQQSHGQAADPPRDAPSTSTSSPGHNAGGATPSLPFSLSLTLQNTGSVARDHLASERTFLAYVRTSLAFASAGVALVQLFRVSISASANESPSREIAVVPYARPLGATLIAFGMAVLTMGTLRYFAIQRALPQGLFPAARLSVFLQAVSLAALVGIVFGILVAVR